MEDDENSKQMNKLKYFEIEKRNKIRSLILPNLEKVREKLKKKNKKQRKIVVEKTTAKKNLDRSM